MVSLQIAEHLGSFSINVSCKHSGASIPVTKRAIQKVSGSTIITMLFKYMEAEHICNDPGYLALKKLFYVPTD